MTVKVKAKLLLAKITYFSSGFFFYLINYECFSMTFKNYFYSLENISIKLFLKV